MSEPALLARVAAACEPVLADLVADAEVPDDLRAAMRHSLLGGGKRLRPAIVIGAATACGVEDPAGLIRPACALELLHTYSLIHDDLPCMDDADLRRGRPACHRVFGEALAVLAGDALQALAFATLAAPVSGVSPSRQLAAVMDLATAAGAAGMCGGQALDLAAETVTPDDAGFWRLQALKTGALIRAAARIGGHLAGAADGAQAMLDLYGTRLGRAFQIADDVLDVVGTAGTLGKATGGDARHGKSTAVTRYGLDAARQMASEAAAVAVAAVAGFGPAAEPLAALAVYAARREH